jgi:hypothetical protein
MTLSRSKAAFILLMGLTLALILVNTGIGSVYFSPAQIWDMIVRPQDDPIAGSIIWKIRIPRAMAAVLGGAYLAVSGLGHKSGDTIPIYSFLAFYRLSLALTFGSKALQDDQKTMVRRADVRYVHAFTCH